SAGRRLAGRLRQHGAGRAQTRLPHDRAPAAAGDRRDGHEGPAAPGRPARGACPPGRAGAAPRRPLDDRTPRSRPGPHKEELMTSLAQRTYVIGVWILAAAVLVQFLLAGLGIFADGTFIGLHATLGAALVGVLSLLLVGVGRIAGVAGRTLWLTAAVA